MLQNRYEIYLTKQQEGLQTPRSWRCRRKTRDPRGIARANLAVVAGESSSAGAQGVADYIERFEEGYSNQELAKAVASVVDIKEEGLFRKIVLYL